MLSTISTYHGIPPTPTWGILGVYTMCTCMLLYALHPVQVLSTAIRSSIRSTASMLSTNLLVQVVLGLSACERSLHSYIHTPIPPHWGVVYSVMLLHLLSVQHYDLQLLTDASRALC